MITRVLRILSLLACLTGAQLLGQGTSPSSDVPARYRGFTIVGHEIPVSDLAKIKAENGNFVRWMLYHTWPWRDATDFEEYQEWLAVELDKLDLVMAECERLGIKVAVDMHDVPGGRMDDQSQRMFYDQKYIDQYVSIWQEIAERYQGHPALYGYGLMNEPVEINGAGLPVVADCIAAQMQAAVAIREIDPETPIIFASTAWNAPQPFFSEAVPLDNVIYEVHVYQPMQYSHQGITGFPFDTPYAYPGEMTPDGWVVDQAVLRNELAKVRAFQLAHPGARIFVGEFSAVRWAGGADQWLSDYIDLFEEYQWDWAYHAWTANDYFSLDIESGTTGSDPVPAPENERKSVILRGLELNQ